MGASSLKFRTNLVLLTCTLLACIATLEDRCAAETPRHRFYIGGGYSTTVDNTLDYFYEPGYHLSGAYIFKSSPLLQHEILWGFRQVEFGFSFTHHRFAATRHPFPAKEVESRYSDARLTTVAGRCEFRHSSSTDLDHKILQPTLCGEFGLANTKICDKSRFSLYFSAGLGLVLNARENNPSVLFRVGIAGTKDIGTIPITLELCF